MIHHKILIIDDEPVIAEELSEFLDSFDYQCDIAFGADEAITKVAEDENITLVLTDMRMPGKDGAELIRELKAIEGRAFQFMMISGHLDADQDLQDIKGDDVTLMRKPINIEELMEFLEGLEFSDA